MNEHESEVGADEQAELALLASVKRRLDKRTFEVVERGAAYGGWIVKVVWGLIAMTVAVTGFVIRSQFRDYDHDRRLNEFDKVRVERAEQIKRLEVYDQKHDTDLSTLKRDVDDFVQLRPDVREMIFMRNNGISNKEWFSRKNGYRAPGESSSESQPVPHATPTPHPQSQN